MLATKPKKRAKLRHSEYYDMQGLFDKLYQQSTNGYVFTDLVSLIAREENIRLAYRNIKRNHGSHTSGMDKVTIKEIQTLNAENYVERIQQMLSWYTPRPVRRKEIPKANGKMRPLGIPSIWDRLFQQCILQVLEPICEAKFHERSNGFRPNRSAQHAIAQCYSMINLMGLTFVVDVDIKGFFDNVNHTKLIQQMWELGIRDKNLLCIIRKILKAPVVMPDGTIAHPEKGTPQGGILSPLLSNIVLNELDWWVASNWENMPMKHPPKAQYNSNGSRNKGNDFRSLRSTKLKEMYIVRYADDFKIFCRTRSSADRTYHAIIQWLSERLHLDVSEEKSSVTNLKKRYTEFLGIKMRAVPKSGKRVVESHVADKALRRVSETLKGQIGHIARPKNGKHEHYEVGVYNAMVMGMHNYYSMATHVSKDFKRLSKEIGIVWRCRLRNRLERKGEIKNKAIQSKYGSSRQMRFLGGTPVVPIGFVQTHPPRWKKRSINAYTPQGRAEIHKNLGLNMHVLHQLMRSKELNRTIEFMDNRLSLYCAQYGKCAVSGRILECDEIHCHHKKPKGKGGNDAYQNLVIVHADIHRLIHATKKETINKYLAEFNLDRKALNKLNALRKLVGNEDISDYVAGRSM